VNLRAAPTLDELKADPGRAGDLPAQAASDLLTELEGEIVRTQRLRDALLVRSVVGDSTVRKTKQGDEMLDVDAAAQLLGVSKRWLYVHARDLPFTLQDGKRCKLRFSAVGIARYVRERQGS
jgi:hypothetical protein